jgi:hypothetical protein
VVACREVDETVDSAVDPDDAAAAYVFEQELSRVACFGGLLRGEVAVLSARQLLEAVPVRTLRGGGGHAQIVTIGLVLCKGEGGHQKARSRMRLGLERTDSLFSNGIAFLGNSGGSLLPQSTSPRVFEARAGAPLARLQVC